MTTAGAAVVKGSTVVDPAASYRRSCTTARTPSPTRRTSRPGAGEQAHDPALGPRRPVARPADPQRRADDDDGGEHRHRDHGQPQRRRA